MPELVHQVRPADDGCGSDAARDCLAKGREVRVEAEMVRRQAVTDAEAHEDLVGYEQCPVMTGDGLDVPQVSVGRHQAGSIGQDRLVDDGSDVVVVLEKPFHVAEVVETQQRRPLVRRAVLIVEPGFRVRHVAERDLVKPAVEPGGHLRDPLAPGQHPGNPGREVDGLAAGVAEGHFLQRSQGPGECCGRALLGRMAEGRQRPVLECRGASLHDGRMCMAEHRAPVAHRGIDVAQAVVAEEVGAGAADDAEFMTRDKRQRAHTARRASNQAHAFTPVHGSALPSPPTPHILMLFPSSCFHQVVTMPAASHRSTVCGT